VLSAQFSRLATGTRNLESELGLSSEEAITQDPAKKAEARKRLKQEIAEHLGPLQALEKTILEKANDLHGHHALSLEFGKELRKPFDIETLLISLGRQDLAVIKNCNPSLSDEEITEIMQDVARYAYARCAVQQLQRAHRSLLEAPYEYLMHARAKRAYNPQECPKLLIFETLGDLILREEQIAALDSLREWTLLEARTGFGKSKVLMPLWILLSAQDAVFIAPSALFHEAERHLQTLLKKGWRFFGVTLTYSRSSSSESKDLAAIEARIMRAERERKPIFMSDQTAHNLFVLKPKELAEKKSSDLPALLRLRALMKNRKLFIDEPQKVLNDAHESNYSIGMPEFVEKERMQFEIDLYRHLFLAVEKSYQLEFWFPSDKPPLTEAIYRSKIIPALLDKFSYPREADAYLRGQLSFEEQEEFEKRLTDSRIRLLHDQLHHFLPQTLQKQCHEHYSLVDVESDRTVVPLEDARNAKKGNEFVSLDQTLNFTLQANLKTPFSLKYIQVYLENLRTKATEEREQTKKELKNTRAYHQFLALTEGMVPPPSGLFTMKPLEIERISQYINSNFLAKLHLIHFDILPKVRSFPEKLISTPHHLVHVFKEVVGASGTLSMQHFPYQFSVKANEKAMARTLAELIKKKTPVLEVDGGFTVIANVQTICPQASVMIEVGASLRDYKDLVEVGNILLTHYSQFEGVATFDENGYPIVMSKGSSLFMPKELSDIALDKLFWVYGQKDTTGRDEKLPPEAHAVVFINKDTTMTKLVQGVGRMRGILNRQTAVIVLDREGAYHIRHALEKTTDESLTLFDIYNYTALQEGLTNGFANFRSLSLQWDALLENTLWDKTLETEDAAKQLYEMREFLIQTTRDNPLARRSFNLAPMKIETVLPRLMAAFDAKVKTALQSGRLRHGDIETIENKRKEIQAKMDYPLKVFFNHSASDTQAIEVTAQQMVSRQAEAFTQAEQHATETKDSETFGLQLAYLNTLKEKKTVPHQDKIIPHELSKLFTHPRLQKYLPLFEHVPLWISENSFTTFEGDRPDSPGFINGYMKPLSYIALLPDRKFVLIDTAEAANCLREKQRIPMLYLVNQGAIFGEMTIPPQVELAAKILNGDLEFTPDQKKLLQGKEQLLEAFVRKILAPLKPL
jgi:hypothetical protein